ncbi:class II aldolase/adducin family protein [Rhodococcoides fascians]|uniref:class II aldolase/adducin family protein n=1 Tax=Rhodococcoides fascians TaxID=1828 RepID=UPI001DC5EEF6|nr:class II aldolase/adducin family protein [Rhodococcus fascians]CAH0244646.1 Decarboxylase NovR [Rhodococcus fascians]
MSVEISNEPVILSQAERKLAVNLAFASRMLSGSGHDDFNQGQVSARMPGSSRFLIKGALRGFSEATPTDMVVGFVDHEMTVDRMAPPELPLHQAIYVARPDVNAIVHSHAPHSLVFGALDAEIEPISHEGALFQDSCPRFDLTSNTVLDIETGNAIAVTLGANPGVFLRNHGGVLVGRTLRHAAVGAQLLERACRLQLLAMQTRLPYSVSNADDVRAKRDYIYGDDAVKTYWDYSVRTVKQTWPQTQEWR